MKVFFTKLTQLFFILIAIFPMVKPNINSWILIGYLLLTIYFLIQNKKLFKLDKSLIWYTLPFWIFLIHELIFKDFYLNRVFLHLFFIVFPFVFYYKPVFITNRHKQIALRVFQISVVIQSLYFLVLFLIANPAYKLFSISNENIPFFRHYVFNHSFFEIHPTYFSAFLLTSFTYSFFQFKKSNAYVILDITNMLFAVFFIFLFSSKVVILLLGFTIIYFILQIFKEKNQKKLVVSVLLVTLVSGMFIVGFKNIIIERFDEIRTEINKPIVGDYYNSINVRVAIYKCSVELLKEAPFFGYGNELQSSLNSCYAAHNQSDFYKGRDYNTHNYYINLILYGGWLFLFLFMGYLMVIWRKIKYNTFTTLFFIQIMLINTTENFFSRHYGLVLFTYIIYLSIFFKDKQENENVLK